jgi:hypothetical protein
MNDLVMIVLVNHEGLNKIGITDNNFYAKIVVTTESDFGLKTRNYHNPRPR